MSMADGDGMYFHLKPGNKKSVNFDKTDIDFNLDMSDLEMEDGQPKEKPKESSRGKNKDIADQFSFAFDVDELDSFNFESSLLREGSEVHKDKSKKESPPGRSECEDKEGSVSEILDAPNVRENKKPASEIHKLPLVSPIECGPHMPWSPDQEISQTITVSYIKGNRIFVVADGLTTDAYEDKPVCGDREKINIIEDKIAATTSGVIGSSNELVEQLKKLARSGENYHFSQLCDMSELYSRIRCEEKGCRFYPSTVIIAGFEEITKKAVIDIVTTSRESYRRTVTKEGELVGSGCGENHAHEQYDVLKSEGYFVMNSSEADTFKYLTSCVLASCIKSDACGGWLTHALLEDGKAKLHLDEHVVNLIPEYFDLLELNDVFAGAGVVLSVKAPGTSLEQHREKFKNLKRVVKVVMIGCRLEIGVAAFVLFVEPGKTWSLCRTELQEDFPHNDVVPATKNNFKVLADAGYFRTRGIGI